MTHSETREIDLIEICQTIWDGKWFVGAFVAATTLIGHGYAQSSQDEHLVSVPFAINLYPSSIHHSCSGVGGCLDIQLGRELALLLEDHWEVKSNKLLLTTTQPMAEDWYTAKLERASSLLKDKATYEARNDLEWIANETNDVLIGTETVSKIYVHAKRSLLIFDTDKGLLEFGSISIAKIRKKYQLTVALSVLLGLMIGVLYVLLASEMRKQKGK